MIGSYSSTDNTIMIGTTVFLAGVVLMAALTTSNAPDLSPEERAKRIALITMAEAFLLIATFIVLLLTSF